MKKTQKQQIREYLENNGKLTSLAALNFWGCFRLASRINDLRREGMDIKTEIVTTSNKKRIAQYSCITE